jgi:hypothetical protein
MNLRVSREVNLGCGAWIRVEQVPKGQLKAHISDQACEAFWSETYDTQDRYYGRIFLDRDLPKKYMRERYFHELKHAGISVWDRAIKDRLPSADLPSSIHLGYGVWIKVEQIGKGQMKASFGADEDVMWTETIEADNKYYGRIFVNKDLPKKEKRYLFFMMLNHGLVDVHSWSFDERNGR